MRVTTRRSLELIVESSIGMVPSTLPSRAASVTCTECLLPAAPANLAVNRAGNATFFTVSAGITCRSTHSSLSARSLSTRMRAPASGCADALTTTTPIGPSVSRSATSDGASTSRFQMKAAVGGAVSFADNRPRPTENRSSFSPALSFTGTRTKPQE